MHYDKIIPFHTVLDKGMNLFDRGLIPEEKWAVYTTYHDGRPPSFKVNARSKIVMEWMHKVRKELKSFPYGPETKSCNFPPHGLS